MGLSGYEQSFYRDVERARQALESIAESLDLLLARDDIRRPPYRPPAEPVSASEPDQPERP